MGSLGSAGRPAPPHSLPWLLHQTCCSCRLQGMDSAVLASTPGLSSACGTRGNVSLSSGCFLNELGYERWAEQRLERFNEVRLVKHSLQSAMPAVFAKLEQSTVIRSTTLHLRMASSVLMTAGGNTHASACIAVERSCQLAGHVHAYKISCFMPRTVQMMRAQEVMPAHVTHSEST